MLDVIIVTHMILLGGVGIGSIIVGIVVGIAPRHLTIRLGLFIQDTLRIDSI